MVGIKAAGDVSVLADKLAAVEEVTYVVICTGRFDLFAEVVCRDDEHLLQLLNATIRTLPEVRDAEIFIYLDLIKHTYAWGPADHSRPLTPTWGPNRRSCSSPCNLARAFTALGPPIESALAPSPPGCTRRRRAPTAALAIH